ncbi:MAG TPA: DUF6537 domain-containing protein, partial [Rhodocyclaceae bacterium]|nr:DUF6537 domain-containing protein [Rhodocyclaceae bacterium]
FHLAPSWLGRPDPDSGEMKKRAFGPWLLPVFGLLARLKFLRGTVLDIFGLSAERRIERELIREYEAALTAVLAVLRPENHALAIELARLPEAIRGYGPVKLRGVVACRARRAQLLASLGA